MWIILFACFLFINTIAYFVFQNYKENKAVSGFYLVFFLISLFVFLNGDESWILMKYFHSLLMTGVYYIFLMVSLLQFDYLDKNKYYSQRIIKKNIRIMVGIACTLVQTDTFLYYS